MILQLLILHWEFNTHWLCERWMHFSLGEHFQLWTVLL